MTDNLVELPLDPEFITPDGMYMAGYLWGQHVRSPKDAAQMFDCNAYPDFYKGVEDGYGDKMREMEQRTKVKKEQAPQPQSREFFEEQDKLINELSMGQSYNTYIERLYKDTDPFGGLKEW